MRARFIGLPLALLLCCAVAVVFWPQKLFWKGLYIGQDRAAAHAVFYDITRYQSRFGGEPHYCVTNIEEWRASLPPDRREQYDDPIGCLIDADLWSDSATCFPIGRPCSESIEVTLRNDRVHSIEVHWGFMP